MGTRALEGRRTEALVCRPSRAGRVLAPIFRWFLHRLISKAPPARKNIFLNAIGSSPTQSTPVRTLTEPYPGAHGSRYCTSERGQMKLLKHRPPRPRIARCNRFGISKN